MVQYLPAWFPGAGFKRKAAQCREMVTEMSEVPFTMAKDEMSDFRSFCIAVFMILLFAMTLPRHVWRLSRWLAHSLRYY
ncbi:hypothetical protein EDC04DRAFT_1769890 [Pisolithus marmoratus]|nr:hypothetical protein EDC04DRAFT_1769890 [Pisolithus marmoratus]